GGGVGSNHGHRSEPGLRRSAPVAVVDAVDIVWTREWVAVGCKTEAQREFAREQIDSDVNAGVMQRLHPRAESIEVLLVESRQIEFQTAVGRLPRPCSHPGMWADREIRR